MNRPHLPSVVPTSPNSVVVSTTHYTCPMHPEIDKPHPGNCPKCGMTLVPVA